jgi:hypothetical protein
MFLPVVFFCVALVASAAQAARKEGGQEPIAVMGRKVQRVLKIEVENVRATRNPVVACPILTST